jgi:RNA polymerase sigma factor (sigma-70 family)
VDLDLRRLWGQATVVDSDFFGGRLPDWLSSRLVGNEVEIDRISARKNDDARRAAVSFNDGDYSKGLCDRELVLPYQEETGLFGFSLDAVVKSDFGQFRTDVSGFGAIVDYDPDLLDAHIFSYDEDSHAPWFFYDESGEAISPLPFSDDRVDLEGIPYEKTAIGKWVANYLAELKLKKKKTVRKRKTSAKVLDKRIRDISSRKGLQLFGKELLPSFRRDRSYGLEEVFATISEATYAENEHGNLPPEYVEDLTRIIHGEASIRLLVNDSTLSFAAAYLEALYTQVQDSDNLVWPFGDLESYPVIGDKETFDRDDEDRIMREKSFEEMSKFARSFESSREGIGLDSVLEIFRTNIAVFRAYKAVVAHHFAERRMKLDDDLGPRNIVGDEYSPFCPHWKNVYKQIGGQLIVQSRVRERKDYLKKKKQENKTRAEVLYEKLSGLPILALRDDKLGKMLRRNSSIREALFLGSAVNAEIARTAAWTIVSRFEGLAQKYPSRFVGLGPAESDLQQEAREGAYAATGRFDYRRDIKFGTYARWWMKARITKEINRYHGLKMSNSLVEVVMNLQGLRHDVMKKERVLLGDEALAVRWATKKIKNADSMTEAKYQKQFDLFHRRALEVMDAWNNKRRAISLNSPASDGPNPKKLRDMIKDDSAPDPSSGEGMRKISLASVLEKLTKRQRYVLRMRHAIDGGDEDRTLKEVGDLMGLSRERVRQIEAEAYKIIKEEFGFNPFR